MVVLFLPGYLAIALEHPLMIEKAAGALLPGSIPWALYALFSEQFPALGFFGAMTIVEVIDQHQDTAWVAYGSLAA